MLPPILIRADRAGHRIQTEGSWNLNIIGVRSQQRDQSQDQFDDVLHLVFKDHFEKWVTLSFPISTDPGLYWLKHGREAGTAILKAGQYKAWKLGKHKGLYPALVQHVGQVTIYRDRNKDDFIDMNEDTVIGGYYGINIHKSGLYSENIGRYSAGCQVFKSELHFDIFMSFCQVYARLYQDEFTYTLLED